MAEALLRKYAGDYFEVLSAGTDPKGIHPLTKAAMQEVGLSMEGHRSKSLGEFLGKITVNHVIVVCTQADEQCPRVWTFALQRHFWPFDDPAAAAGTNEQKLAEFRRVRDQIDARIQNWLVEIADA
jgi:arsenate reductase